MMKKLIMGLMGLTVLTLGGLSTATADDGDSLSFWEKTSLHGTFNTSYTYNLNNPPIATVPNNFGRVFNVGSQTFRFNRAELEIENAPADWVKFRLDIAFGQDVATVDGLKGAPVAADEVGVQQAYVDLTAPVGNGLTFKIGHWATIIGAEVIESGYNWNTSRSFLFGFAIPFTHVGLLMTYPFNDWFSASIGVINGWDAWTDINKAKTGIWQLAFTPTDDLSLSLQGTAGPDADASGFAANDSQWLTLIDFVVNWQATEDLAFMLNFDWASQAGFGKPNTDWWGVAAYVHYVFNDYFGVTGRGEYFDDNSGFRFAIAPAVTDTQIAEGTATFHFYMSDGVEARFEIRHDQANKAVFTKANGTTRKYQDTVSAEIVYNF